MRHQVAASPFSVACLQLAASAVISSEDSAVGETLVRVESCVSGNGFVGNGAGNCPFLPGEYTFYGRCAAVAGQISASRSRSDCLVQLQPGG